MPKKKPNILLGWGGEWWCYSNEGFMGRGATVVEAYQDWTRRQG